MSVKTKVYLKAPLIGWRGFRARGMAKKINKMGNESRYSEQYKNDFILKRAKQMAKTLNVELEVIGWDNVPKSVSVLTPNHASFFDPALIVMALAHPEPTPDNMNIKSVFVAKDDIQKNKKVRGYADILHTFYIDRQNPRTAIEVLDEMVKHGKETKKHLVIFPEGTRTKDGNMGEFKGGAFNVAKKAYLPVVPVTINNAMSITNLDRKGKLKVQVIFHAPIKPSSFIASDTKAIAERVQKVVASKYKKQEGTRSAKESKIA